MSLTWWSSMWVTRLERPKGVKDEVKQARRAQSRPEGPQARLLVPYKRVLSSAASKLSMGREIGKGGSVVLQKIRYLSC